MNSSSVCAILVSFNRKDLLVRCIEAVSMQTYPVQSILVVDNASSDGTFEHLCHKGFIQNREVNESPNVVGQLGDHIDFRYIQLKKNIGGAGGFHTGLKAAFELGTFDYFWVMDDDGYPSASCLQNLMEHVQGQDYLMPVSIDIDNHAQLSWPSRMPNGKRTIMYEELKAAWGKVMDYIFPFNGSLMSQKLVAEVGYPNKDLFIWGDEYDHYWRCIRKGFKPITITQAQFYHPANKMEYVPILGGLIKVPFSESKLRFTCLIRNSTYLDRNYGKTYKIIPKLFIYFWLFIFTRKGDWAGFRHYLLCVKDGLEKKFDRHLQYLKS